MTINAQIIDQRVRRIAEERRRDFAELLKIRNDDDRLHSAAFVFLVTKTVLDLTDEEAVDSMVEGGGDFGVDAISFTSPTDNEFRVTIVQGKYKKNFEEKNEFGENDVIKMINAVGTLFDPQKLLSANKRMTERIEEIRSLVSDGAIPRVHVILCSNGRRWNSDGQARIDQAGFGDQVTWEHVDSSKLVALLQATKPVDDTLQLTGRAIVENFDFRRAMVGRVAVRQLAALFDRHGDRLLERNVRRYLGLTGSRINEGIASTLRDPDQRANFYFYNNGITIICTHFSYNALMQENWSVKLSGLQIVNGGQTSKTVQQVVKEDSFGLDAADAYVLVRIYELPENDVVLVNNIAYATNSQNPVDLRDLRSNDDRQKQLKEAIGSLGYNYRRQRGDQASQPNDLTSATVAEAVLAVWRRRPHQARFMSSQHFGNLYEVIFSDTLNGAQAVIAALLLRFAENKRKRPPADAPEFLPYASRFIAMLMGRYLLENLKIDLRQLDHRNFHDAMKKFEECAEDDFAKAVDQISSALKQLYGETQVSLQRLSATFRRGDVVEQLEVS
ncbi:MAG: AIPR family protein [Alphaproteobacteria bacterium]